MDPVTGLVLLGKFILAKAGVAGASSAVAGAVGGAAVIAVIGTLVYISYLTMNHMRDFFRNKKHYKTPHNHGVSYKAALKSGKRVVVRGFFDNDGDAVSSNAVETVEYGSMSSELENLHSDGKIVEYT